MYVLLKKRSIVYLIILIKPKHAKIWRVEAGVEPKLSYKVVRNFFRLGRIRKDRKRSFLRKAQKRNPPIWHWLREKEIRDQNIQSTVLKSSSMMNLI